jgi:hypothetical protein
LKSHRYHTIQRSRVRLSCSRAREVWLKPGRNPGGWRFVCLAGVRSCNPGKCRPRTAPFCRPLALFAPPEHGVSPPEPQLPSRFPQPLPTTAAPNPAVASRSPQSLPQSLPAVAVHPCPHPRPHSAAVPCQSLRPGSAGLPIKFRWHRVR